MIFEADETSVLIEVTSASHLKTEWVWPDGDEPDVVTAKAVLDQMNLGTSILQTLLDWNLLEDPDVKVTVRRPNPHWSDDPVMFDEHAPVKYVVDTAET